MSASKTTGLLETGSDEVSAASGWIALAALLASFVAATYGFGIYLFAQLVTDMRADLGFDYGTAGTITAAAQVGFLAFALAGAWLAPRVGGGQVVVGSVALCGVSLMLLPTTDDILIVGLLLTVLGGTAASVWVPMVEIVSRAIPYRHRGKVLGLASGGTSYGVFINSLLVPVFVTAGDWRGVWTTVGLGTLAATLVAVLAFRRLGLFRREPVPASAAREGRATAPGSIGSLLGSGAAPWILLVWTITFLNGFSTLPFQNYLAPYLREELGFPVTFAAQVWGLVGLVGMFAGFAVGWLSDRTGVRAALLGSYGCVLLSSLLLVFAPFGPLPLVAGILFALAFYPVFGLVPAYVAKMATGAEGTLVFGVANVTLGIGGVIGNAVGGAVKDASGTFVWIYVGVALASVALAVLSLALPREREAAPDQPFETARSPSRSRLASRCPASPSSAASTAGS